MLHLHKCYGCSTQSELPITNKHTISAQPPKSSHKTKWVAARTLPVPFQTQCLQPRYLYYRYPFQLKRNENWVTTAPLQHATLRHIPPSYANNISNILGHLKKLEFTIIRGESISGENACGRIIIPYVFACSPVYLVSDCPKAYLCLRVRAQFRDFPLLQTGTYEQHHHSSLPSRAVSHKESHPWLTKVNQLHLQFSVQTYLY